MITAVKAATARIGDSAAADWFGKIGDVLDCIIPIVLSLIAAVSLGMIALGLVH